MERQVLEFKNFTGTEELYIATDEIAAINFTNQDNTYVTISIILKNGLKKKVLVKVNNQKGYDKLKKEVLDKFKGNHNMDDYLK